MNEWLQRRIAGFTSHQSLGTSHRRKWLGMAGAALMLTGLVALAVTAQGKQATTSSSAQASTSDKWLHVRVIEDGRDGEKGETVRVNVPLSLAEAILPALKVHDKIEAGRVKIRHHHWEGNEIDFRAAFDAVKKAPDGEFVTVQKGDSEEVRVSKQGGYFLVNVRDDKVRKDGTKRSEKVDVKVPMSVAEALFSGAPGELDILAAVRALARHGDTQLVAVEDGRTTVRVWVDSKNTSE